LIDKVENVAKIITFE